MQQNQPIRLIDIETSGLEYKPLMFISSLDKIVSNGIPSDKVIELAPSSSGGRSPSLFCELVKLAIDSGFTVIEFDTEAKLKRYVQDCTNPIVQDCTNPIVQDCQNPIVQDNS